MRHLARPVFRRLECEWFERLRRVLGQKTTHAWHLSQDSQRKQEINPLSLALS